MDGRFILCASWELVLNSGDIGFNVVRFAWLSRHLIRPVETIKIAGTD